MLPPFGWQAVLEQWQFAPVVTALAAVLAALYLWGAWRVGQAAPGAAVAVVAGRLLLRPGWPSSCWPPRAASALTTTCCSGTTWCSTYADHGGAAAAGAGQPVTLLLHASRNPLHTWTKRVIRSRVATFLTWPPFALARTRWSSWPPT